MKAKTHQGSKETSFIRSMKAKIHQGSKETSFIRSMKAKTYQESKGSVLHKIKAVRLSEIERDK
ncbi:hypothetical protein [Bacillus sp. UNC438CL73TsuS30]|uniref:hypothetical protein n=1 Tax=Bacillus sp. UNC438CL73TsuS30 TaxID=1340434 RepID=UPI00047B6312|nr:hypothetical protein [Bacillus sp. UNC438CL73TsuS30]